MSFSSPKDTNCVWCGKPCDSTFSAAIETHEKCVAEAMKKLKKWIDELGD